MPVLSRRVQAAFASPFRKYIPLAEAARRRGVEVIHLNIGQPDFPMPPDVLGEMWSRPQAYIPYGDALGQPQVRQAWISYYRRFGVQLMDDEMLITAGASEAILFTMMAIADPGDEVIVPEPFYANYNGFAQMAGVGIKPVSTRIEQGFRIPALSAFQQAITPKTRAVMLSNPGNPTGKVYDLKVLMALAELARDHQIFLVVDEAYSEFIYDDVRFYSALRLSGFEEHIVVIDSVSKRFNACGVRVGAIATRNKTLVESVARYARLRLSAPMLGQEFASRALLLPGSYHQSVRHTFALRRTKLLDRLQKMTEVIYHPPEGAFYFMVKLPIDDAERFCAWLLTDFHYAGSTIMLSPGSSFYATDGRGCQEVRMAYVVEEPELDRAMDCLEIALQHYPGRSPLYPEVTE